MKRFKITGILFAALLIVTSCDKDFEEINQDPNNPTSLPSHLIIPTAVRNMQNRLNSTFVGGDMGACWSQQFAKVQYNDEARYIPRQSIISATWTTLYGGVGNSNTNPTTTTGVLSQADAIYNLAEVEENTVMMGLALVLQAHSYSVAADMYGDVPFSEAIRGDEGIIAPAYDAQESVYNGIISMLSQAISLLDSGVGTIDSGSDILYGGDAGLWKKFAASLQFRCLMRISGKQNVSSQLQALVNSGNLFSSNAEEAKLIYLSASPSANPLYETVVFGTRGEWKVNSVIVDMMLDNNDPRLPQIAQLNDAGIYRGKPSGYSDVPNNDYNYTNVSAIGSFYLRPEAPGYYISNAQLQFLMAEAAQKGYISGSASMYYEAGITASFEANGVSDNGYISSNSLSGSTALQQIGTEMWKALFAQGVESWTEQRRTGYPMLSPAIEGDINHIPRRYNYPTIESSINAANYEAAVASQGADNLSTPVWWMN